MTSTVTAPHVVYPKNGHQAAESSTFVMGAVPPGHGCQVSVNGTVLDSSAVLVAAGGSFAATLQLKLGNNTVQLTATSPSGQPEQTTTLTLKRQGPLHHNGAAPPNLVLSTMTPPEPTAMMRGDWLHVGVWVGRADAQVSVTIPGLVEDPVPLAPLTGEGFVDTRHGIFAQLHQTTAPIPQMGYFTGAINLPWVKNEPESPAPLVFHLEIPNSDAGGDRLNNVISLQSLPNPTSQTAGPNSHSQMVPNHLRLWTQPRQTVATQDKAITRTAPFDGARLTPLPVGTPLVIREVQGPWLCAALAAHQKVWVHQDDCAPLTLMQTPRPPSPVRLIRIDGLEDNRHAKLRVLGLPKVPIQIDTTLTAGVSQLSLDVFGVVSHCDFIHWEPGTQWITGGQWRQVQDNVMRLTLTIPQLAGYDYGFDADGLWLTLKRLPTNPHDLVILLDPGHGGAELGSVGPTGVAEKALNLAVAHKLAGLLKQQGFIHTHLTRTHDEAVSLVARSDMAQQLNADVVLSIHHNALPDGRNPLAERGTSTYFYHGFAKPWADTLQQTLVPALGLPDYGVLYDSLHLCRIHTGLAALVELGFMTHPTEYERLLTESFQAKAADTLVEAIQRCAESTN
jgi:N-acetylmuramoyl-L-alanine amidase